MNFYIRIWQILYLFNKLAHFVKHIFICHAGDEGDLVLPCCKDLAGNASKSLRSSTDVYCLHIDICVSSMFVQLSESFLQEHFLIADFC